MEGMLTWDTFEPPKTSITRDFMYDGASAHLKG